MTERSRCEAKTRSGSPCKRFPTPGRKRCNLHGGKTLAGPASGTYKHGRYSKYLTGDLVARYDESSDNPELLSLWADVALVEARLTQALELIESGGASELWINLDQAWKRFVAAVREGDKDEQAIHLAQLNNIIERGREDRKLWTEISGLIEQKRKLVETEQRLSITAEKMVDIERVLGYMAALVFAIKESAQRHAEPETARQIIVDASAAYTRLVGAPADS